MDNGVGGKSWKSSGAGVSRLMQPVISVSVRLGLKNDGWIYQQESSLVTLTRTVWAVGWVRSLTAEG